MKLTIAVTLISLSIAYAAVTPLRHMISTEQIEKIAAWTPEDAGYPWEMSGQYEGDMILTRDQKNGMVNSRYRWPSNTLVYEFDFTVSESDRTSIRNALNYYNTDTCLTIRERQSESDYVIVTTDNSGCWSYVGRIGGRQALNLQSKGCIYNSIILHEFLHALGFRHMHSTFNRDDYVEILWDNIEEGRETAFNKYASNVVTDFGEAYDYKSVMHYSETAFTANGKPTIRALDGTSPLGNGVGLTATDRAKLQLMYGC